MPDRFSSRVFALAAVALLAYLLYRVFEPFFGPILWATLIAFLLFPLNLRVRRAVHGRLGLSATLLTAVVGLGFVLPAVGIAAAFGSQAVDLVQRLGVVAKEYEIHTPQDLTRLPVFGRVVDWVESHSPVSAAQIQSSFLHGVQTVVQFLLAHTSSVLVGAFGVIGNITLMLFVLFFFFRDGDQLAARGVRLIPLEARTEGEAEAARPGGHAGRRVRNARHGDRAGDAHRDRVLDHRAAVADRLRGGGAWSRRSCRSSVPRSSSRPP